MTKWHSCQCDCTLSSRHITNKLQEVGALSVVVVVVVAVEHWSKIPDVATASLRAGSNLGVAGLSGSSEYLSLSRVLDSERIFH